MLLIITVIAFVLLLKHHGRIGPFVWDGPPSDRGTDPAARRCGHPDPETVLADRLANGDIAPEEYLERLSLLQEK